ncbi:MAG: HemK family protein methyltransferase [Bacteroidales bacterium]|nr:HemK family protein methyltransferase [Bacteroidales bacterium]
MTYRDFIAMAVERLAPIYGADEARAAASALLCHYLGIQPYIIIAEPETEICVGAAGAVSGASGASDTSGGAGASDASGVAGARGAISGTSGTSETSGGAAEALFGALARMEEGCPLQYVLGFTEFCGMKVRVSQGCLIPRPETEEMVSLILDTFEPPVPEGEPFNILDLCTGSGCIAYALARAFPEAQVFGCDISTAALDVACRQRIKVGGARPVFFQADILKAPPAGLPKFSLIVSNPPYVMESERAQMRRNVLDYEPSEALFVPDDDPLRFYAAIRSWASALLLPGGEIWMEINERLGAETAAVFGENGDNPPPSPAPAHRAVEVLQDLSGKDRFIRVR